MSARQFKLIIIAWFILVGLVGALGWFVFDRSETQKSTIQETGKEVVRAVNESANEREKKLGESLEVSFSDIGKALKVLEGKMDVNSDAISAHDKSTASSLDKLSKDHRVLALIQGELFEQRKQHDLISRKLENLDTKSDQSLRVLTESMQKLEDSRIRIDELAAQIAAIKNQQGILASDTRDSLAYLTELRGEINELLKKTDVLLAAHGFQESDIKGILAALVDLNLKLAKIDGMIESLGQSQQTVINIQNTITLIEQDITNLTQNITNITYNVEKMHSVVITNIKLLCRSIGESGKPRPSECPPQD